MKSKDKLDEVINITELLNELLNELIKSNEQLDGLICEKEEIDKSKELSSAGAGFNPKSLLVNLVTIMSCFLVAAGTKVVFRYELYGPDYKTEILNYSTDTGKTEKSEEIKKKIIGIDDRQKYEVVTIETENPWKKIYDDYTNTEYYERDIDIVRIYGVDYSDLSEYLELDPNNSEADVEYSKEVERENNLNYQELNQKTIQTVTKETQNPKDYTVGVYTDVSERVITNIFMIGNVLLTYIFSEKILSEKCYLDFTPLKEQIDELVYIIKELKCDKRLDKRRLKRSEFIANKIKNIVDKNSETLKKIHNLSRKSKYKSLLCENKSSVDEIKKQIEEMNNKAHLELKRRRK